MEFVAMDYFIDQSGGFSNHEPRQVSGFAFETPGWPMFHACVRFARRNIWDEEGWIIDHYESGLALSGAGILSSKEQAPAALAALLDSKGAEKVSAALALMGRQHEPRTEDDKKEDDMDRQRAYPERRP